DAHLFGAPIGASITQQHGLEAFTVFSRPAVAAVSIPLMILAGIATYFNSRASIARQSPEAAANPQTALMNKLALYVFPLGVVIGGPFLPIAIIIYWVSNNIWTFAQQHVVFGKIEKEEEAKKEEAIARRAANGPAPGAKPIKTPPAKSPTAKSVKPSSTAKSVNPSPTEGAPDTTATTDGEATSADAASVRKPAPSAQPRNRTPRPGNRPKKRKR
ncbi:MAG TPA: YidC/Oxa1 family membrane protein insertase, partial [Mycobacterium sp.]|nr:YidC/Oxa1 family membrane protein insertase [Mycobacterium sp.]